MLSVFNSSSQLLEISPSSESGMLFDAMGNENNNTMVVNGLNGLNLTAATTADGGNGIHPRAETTVPHEPPTKRIKVEPASEQASEVYATPVATSQTAAIQTAHQTSNVAPIVSQQPVQAQSAAPKHHVVTESLGMPQHPQAVAPIKTENGGSSNSVVTPTSNASNSSSHASLGDSVAAPSKTAVPPLAGLVDPTQLAPGAPPAAVAPGAAPLKSTTMGHLGTKYLAELNYMLREFRKLERQLLGAKGAAQLEESAGSRERREKLHSFILHLEDTVRQIELGVELEAQGKTENGDTAAQTATEDVNDDAKKQMAESSALTNLTKEKEAEENVQKLEEHILANLLPVKVRLKKQLAAQQGASKNPAGMPASRRGMLQPSAARGKGTFAAAADQRRKQAEAARLAAQQQHEQAVRRVSDPTQFGKPLGGGGSSLTQKLHGATLGSNQRTHGSGVGSVATTEEVTDVTTPERKILYAGMVPGSTQIQSGVAAASGVHEFVLEDSNILQQQSDQSKAVVAEPLPHPGAPASLAVKSNVDVLRQTPNALTPPSPPITAPPANLKKDKQPLDSANLSEEGRRKWRKKRRKKKLRRLAKRRERERQRQLVLHQQAQASQPSKIAGGRKKSTVGKGQGKKKGPRAVEYICALCSEAYSSTCEYNPWWALAQHECPKCRKNQVPRVDITSPGNTIEYHPALLAHAEDNGGGGGGGGGAAANVNVMHIAQPQAVASTVFSGKPAASAKDHTSLALDSDSDSDLSELSDCSLSDLSMDSDDSSTDLQSMSPAEQAEHERFGQEYKGPAFSDNHASRLLVLMAHASTCPCRHKLTKHRDICRSTKYLMLHARDCPGTTSTFDVCPFPWCRKVKHMLYHLTSCSDPTQCTICSPNNLSNSLKALTGLNTFRLQKHRDRMIAATKAANAAKPKGVHTTHQKPAVVSASVAPKAPTHRAPATAVPSTVQKPSIVHSSASVTPAVQAKSAAVQYASVTSQVRPATSRPQAETTRFPSHLPATSSQARGTKSQPPVLATNLPSQAPAPTSSHLQPPQPAAIQARPPSSNPPPANPQPPQVQATTNQPPAVPKPQLSSIQTASVGQASGVIGQVHQASPAPTPQIVAPHQPSAATGNIQHFRATQSQRQSGEHALSASNRPAGASQVLPAGQSQPPHVPLQPVLSSSAAPAAAQTQPTQPVLTQPSISSGEVPSVAETKPALPVSSISAVVECQARAVTLPQHASSSSQTPAVAQQPHYAQPTFINPVVVSNQASGVSQLQQVHVQTASIQPAVELCQVSVAAQPQKNLEPSPAQKATGQQTTGYPSPALVLQSTSGEPVLLANTTVGTLGQPMTPTQLPAALGHVYAMSEAHSTGKPLQVPVASVQLATANSMQQDAEMTQTASIQPTVSPSQPHATTIELSSPAMNQEATAESRIHATTDTVQPAQPSQNSALVAVMQVPASGQPQPPITPNLAAVAASELPSPALIPNQASVAPGDVLLLVHPASVPLVAAASQAQTEAGSEQKSQVLAAQSEEPTSAEQLWIVSRQERAKPRHDHSEAGSSQAQPLLGIAQPVIAAATTQPAQLQPDASFLLPASQTEAASASQSQRSPTLEFTTTIHTIKGSAASTTDQAQPSRPAHQLAPTKVAAGVLVAVKQESDVEGVRTNPASDTIVAEASLVAASDAVAAMLEESAASISAPADIVPITQAGFSQQPIKEETAAPAPPTISPAVAVSATHIAAADELQQQQPVVSPSDTAGKTAGIKPAIIKTENLNEQAPATGAIAGEVAASNNSLTLGDSASSSSGSNHHPTGKVEKIADAVKVGC